MPQTISTPRVMHFRTNLSYGISFAFHTFRYPDGFIPWRAGVPMPAFDLHWPAGVFFHQPPPMPKQLAVNLRVLKGKSKDRGIPLPPTFFVIGRDPRCHLRPHCKLVSRMHCAIASWTGRVLVRDLKSSNGTYVNNSRIQGEVSVRDGDTLTVGNLSFAFRIQEIEAAEPSCSNSELGWLMEVPEEPMLHPDCDTSCDILIPEYVSSIENEAKSEEAAGQAAKAPKKDNSGEMSAGQYLRDFFAGNRPSRS